MFKKSLIEYPRLLVIDTTRVGALNATGQIKKNLLNGWPEEAFMQLYASEPGCYHLVQSYDLAASALKLTTAESLLEKIEAYQPQVIYYRPLLDQHLLLHLLLISILKRYPAPLVTHIMDDWPERLKTEDPELARQVDEELTLLFGDSYKALSISEKMSTAFQARYGAVFEAISNGIDPDYYTQISTPADEKKKDRVKVVLRYCGALARNMTLQTIVDIARAVDSLQSELPVCFEVFTMASWRKDFEEAAKHLEGVLVFDSVPDEDYPRLIAEADVLVLGYNFDRESLNYIGYSMPNKLPEYLATGVPVLAVGPDSQAGINYLSSRKLACCVTSNDFGKLRLAIKNLVEDSAYRHELGRKGQSWAFEHLNIHNISGRFQQTLRMAAQSESFSSGGCQNAITVNDRPYFLFKALHSEYDRVLKQLSVANESLQKQARLDREEVEHLQEDLEKIEVVNDIIRDDVARLSCWRQKLEKYFWS